MIAQSLGVGEHLCILPIDCVEITVTVTSYNSAHFHRYTLPNQYVLAGAFKCYLASDNPEGIPRYVESRFCIIDIDIAIVENVNIKLKLTLTLLTIFLKYCH